MYLMFYLGWEIKLRSLMEIFTHAVKRLQDPAVTEAGLLPCLKIIQDFIRATQGGVSRFVNNYLNVLY